VGQAITAAWTATDPAAQVQALQALGNFQDPRTLEVLQPALQSEAAEVRHAALEAMRWGTVSDETALADVRALATNDPEATVRHTALEVLIRYDDQHPATRTLLEKLAAEEGGTYRNFARKELKRIAEEAEARSRPDPQVKSQ
jgi:HEAT repeat protein